ncbi:MAG: hypothetical protein E7631_02070 [Ruminococcaceae bacterium]|nr:hypothetical protein [Oscillospiraceae bacterium]
MTNRENYISIARRTGYEYMPVQFHMCPSLQEKYEAWRRENDLTLPLGERNVGDLPAVCADRETFLAYYKGKDFRPGTHIDGWGVAHEPGSAAAYHMTYMHHPMADFDSVEQILAYPMPQYQAEGLAEQIRQTKVVHEEDCAAIGQMQCTIWETAWYMRGMENLLCDMMSEDPMAEVLLDRVTDIAVQRAVSYAKAGADGIFLGDDIGMQHTIMMGKELYGEWLKPRLKRVIDAAKAVNPELLIFYHSCGHVTELIPQLIEAGVEVLNPVQPECMDFAKIHAEYGDRLSFHGTIGTQSVMPFGTPEEVRKKVFENLDIAGKKGGLYACPTHMLEPEVPLENVIAYIRACMEYRNR